MPDPSPIVLPVVGSNEPAPHISIEVLNDALRQVNERITKNNGYKQQLQQTFNDVQKQLNQVTINDSALSAQKALVEELKAKISDLLGYSKVTDTPPATG